MATPDLNEMNKQIADLRKQLGYAPLAMDVNNIKQAAEELKGLKELLRESRDEMGYLQHSFSEMLNDLSNGRKQLNDIKASLKESASISSKLSDYKRGDVDLSSKELKNIQLKLEHQRKILAHINSINAAGSIEKKNAELTLEKIGKLETYYKNISILKDKIDKPASIKIFSGLADITKSIPGLRAFSDPFQNAEKAAKNATRSNELNKENPLPDYKELSPLIEGFKALGSTLKEAFGPMMLIGLFIEGLAKANKEIVELQKSMAKSTTEARDFRTNLAIAAAESGNINITASKLLETFSSINKQFGYITNFAAQTLVTATKLTNVVGIQSESTNNLAAASELNGINFESAYKSSIGTSYEMQRQAGIQFDLRDILTESGKITGQIRANLGANPAKLAEAVTQAKLFGASIQEVNAAGKSFLDFESSIENELQAELLLGKNLNLERARAAALNGDQVTLAKELTQQAGSFSEYSKMNVLQQQSLAAAIGMQADQLSDILFKQAVQGKNARELRALGEDELAQRLESQTLADKFSATMDKLKGIVTDLATAFMPILNIIGGVMTALAAWPPLLEGVSLLLTGIAARSIAIAAANALGYASMAGPVGVVAGLAAMVGAAVYLNSLNDKATSAGDLISPASGITQISTKEGGLFNLSPNDDVIAAPGLANKIGGSYTDMSETNMLLRQILIKQGTVQIDNTKIGTAFAINTYEIQ